MQKKILFLGLSSGVFCSLAGIIYNRVYKFATYTDFSRIVNMKSIIAMSLAGCLLASLIYWALKKMIPRFADIIFHLLLPVLSFACIYFPLSMKLPLDIGFPELFPGLMIPMVFFPAIAWFAAKPIFIKS
jgi:hypothetical protein